MTRTRSYNSTSVLALCILLIACHLSSVNAKRKRHKDDSDSKSDRGSTYLNPAISTESDKWKKDDHKYDILFGKASVDDDGFSPFLDNDFDRHRKKRHAKKGVSSPVFVCALTICPHRPSVQSHVNRKKRRFGQDDFDTEDEDDDNEVSFVRCQFVSHVLKTVV